MNYFDILHEDLLWIIFIKSKAECSKLKIFEPFFDKLLSGDFNPCDIFNGINFPIMKSEFDGPMPTGTIEEVKKCIEELKDGALILYFHRSEKLGTTQYLIDSNISFITREILYKTSKEYVWIRFKVNDIDEFWNLINCNRSNNWKEIWAETEIGDRKQTILKFYGYVK